MIVGRRAELQVLDGLLAEAANGAGGVTVVRGEAGVGKSALLEHTVERAGALGMRVLPTAGVQAEVHVPYAGLHRLLRTAPDLGRMAQAVLDAPDTLPYRAAAVLLDLFAGSTADPALLLAVEDAHWVDAASWDALSFVARRLGSDRIAMVLTVRDGEDVDRRLARAGLPEVRLDPLTAEESAALLTEVAPHLSDTLRRRVLDEAAGNPLGLVELGRAAARSGAGALLPAWLPLNTRVERTFAGLVAELPPATRSLLLVAAIDDGDDLDEMLDACHRMTGDDIGPDDIEPALATRLVQVDDRFRLRFRHPLLRSALYESATPAQRRRVHAALAEAVADDAGRRVWHRAGAAAEPDERLAEELTEIAHQACYRQAVAIALAAFEQAVRLSEDPAARGSRLVWAADAAAERGDLATMMRLLEQVREDDLPAADRALYGILREVYLGTGWTGSARMGAFAEAVEAMCRDGESARTLQTLMMISVRAYWAIPEPELIARLVAAAEHCGADPDDPRLVVVLGLISPMTRGAWCLRRMAEPDMANGLHAHDEMSLGLAANGLGANPLGNRLMDSATAGLRMQGRLGILSRALISQAMGTVYLGEVRTCLTLAAEGEQLAAETGENTWRLSASLATGFAHALRGDTDAALAIAASAEAVLVPARQFPLLALVQQVRGAAALALGRPEEAFRELSKVFDETEQAYHPYTRFTLFGHLAEAALQCGALARLRELTGDMRAVAAQCPSPALLVGLRFAEAALADTAEAYEAALAEDLTDWSFERARLQHAYGAWMRRRRRVADSRPMLRAAAATFDALGATAWADRSRAELRASGETLRRPVDAARSLTPQETQIARLAAEGLTNNDIAERLFLSRRTVTTHLSRIFPKLGIRTRSELSRFVGSV
ncbi:AAA family ATPase [Actinoplanes sp. NPDC051861]|uniref:helix-turn-helix transcriptional regulator n=1 Tax=Actinoplanes sp. NPDC051861 TaxID=3155170 RepID=UPI003412EE94